MIRILDRYTAREFFGLFALALAVLVVISVIVNLFENLHRFVTAGAAPSDIALYYVYTVPKWTLRIAPVAVLIAAFLSVGRLSRNHELLAMQMASLPPLRIALPIIVLALAVTIGLYGIHEEIAPEANEMALRVREQRIRKSSSFYRTKTQDIWYLTGPDRVLHITHLETRKGEMQQISLYQFSPDFALLERVDAAMARWQDGRWTLRKATVRHFWPGGLDVSVDQVPEMTVRIKVSPEDFARVEKNVEEMSYRELKRYIRQLTRSGVDTQRYRTDLLAKPAMLTVNFIMALLGIAFALRVGRQGLYIHIGTCIGVAFLYWLFFSLLLPLGRNEVLPPILAVWLPNVFFGGISLLGLLKSRVMV